MTHFMILLSLYYHCDVAAENARLTLQQTMACNGVYETIKMAFLTEDDRIIAAELAPGERALILMNGALNFDIWQQQNSDLVAKLREEAQTALLGEIS